MYNTWILVDKGKDMEKVDKSAVEFSQKKKKERGGKLQKIENELCYLQAEGLTIDQIMEYVAQRGIKTCRSNVAAFLKRRMAKAESMMQAEAPGAPEEPGLKATTSTSTRPSASETQTKLEKWRNRKTLADNVDDLW